MSKFNDFQTLNPIFKEASAKSVRNTRREVLNKLKSGGSFRKNLKKLSKLRLK